MSISSPEQIGAGKYLHTDRFSGDLVEAVLLDQQRMQEIFSEQGYVSPVDALVQTQAHLDIFLGTCLGAWVDNKKAPQFIKQQINIGRMNRIQGEAVNLQENLQTLKSVGADEVLNPFASIGSSRVASDIYPGWNPTAYELWLRTGMTSATVPLYEDLLMHRSLPKTAPDFKLEHRSLLRLACAVDALTKIRDEMLASDDYDVSHGYIKSLDGLLTEYDALLTLYEDNPVGSRGGIHGRFFPAPPNYDFGSKTKDKVDLIGLLFSDQVRIGLFDVKTKPKARHQKLGGNIIRISGWETQSLRVRDGEICQELGARCLDYLNDYLHDNPDSKLNDPGYRLAFTASFMIGVIAKLDGEPQIHGGLSSAA